MRAAGAAWRDPADYGYAELPRVGGIAVVNGEPETAVCRTCGRVAIDHTPGEFSIYGQCPDRGPVMPLLGMHDQA